MLKKSFIALLLSSAFLNGLPAAEEQSEVMGCKKCSLRARPNNQPNQYEFYEDYLKVQEQKEKSSASEIQPSK